MKIALLHLDLSRSQKEKSIEKIKTAIETAANKGAEFIVTPEVSVPGYFFYHEGIHMDSVVMTEKEFLYFRRLAQIKKVNLLLAHVKKVDGKYYNACTYINAEGAIIGSYEKHHSHQKGMETWVNLGKDYPIWHYREKKMAVLICSDTYYEDTKKIMKEKAPDILFVPAAWPPAADHIDPLEVWKTCANQTKSLLFVCNQTGKQGMMDMTKAPSVMIEKGKMIDSYAGKEAILLADIADDKNHILSTHWTIYPTE